jgi:hypothetical protein
MKVCGWRYDWVSVWPARFPACSLIFIGVSTPLCCNSPRFTLAKTLSRPRSFALIIKCPLIAHPFGGDIQKAFLFSFAEARY